MPAISGLNAIDLWIGGLAEKKMPFGGFLGSTFNCRLRSCSSKRCRTATASTI